MYLKITLVAPSVRLLACKGNNVAYYTMTSGSNALVAPKHKWYTKASTN